MLFMVIKKFYHEAHEGIEEELIVFVFLFLHYLHALHGDKKY